MQKPVTKERREQIRRYRMQRTIYGMRCPDCGVIRYVGQTARTLEQRLRTHMSKPLNEEMAAWFRSLALQGKRPVMVALMPANGYGDAQSKEKFCIAMCSIVHGRSLFNKMHRGDYVHLYAVKRSWRLAMKARVRAVRAALYAERRAEREANPPKRPARFFTFDGKRLNLAGWAAVVGVSRERMRQRVNACISSGIPVSEAFTTPPGQTMPSMAATA